MATKLDGLFYTLELHTKQFEDGIAKSKESLAGATQSFSGFAKAAKEAMESPVFAAGALALAVAGIAIEATRAANELEDAFKPLTSTLELSAAQFATVKNAITDLSTESPHTAESLASVAGALAKMGEADPKEIAADVRTLALAGDALGKTDLSGLAETLDLIGDAFGLTAAQAREAFTQIAAMTHGKIDLEEFAAVLGKSAVRMKALGVTAQETAATITLLIDKGVDRRQITTGLIDLLEKSSKAEADALDAQGANKEGTARTLTIFAQTVNATTIANKGLVGTLGDLYKALNGNLAQFQQAGLSTTEFAIAQKAAEAATEGATTKILTHDEALAKLKQSADVNNESASALVQILKNDLSAVLVDLGNVYLPPVIAALTALANLFNKTKGAAKDASQGIRESTEALILAAKARAGKDAFGADLNDRTALARAGGVARNIVDHPQILQTPDFELKQAEVALRKAQEIAVALSKTGTANPLLAEALKLVSAELDNVGKNADVTEPKVKGTGKDLTDTGAKATAAADRFKDLIRANDDYADSLGDVSDPLRTVNDKIAVFTAQANEYIAGLTGIAKANATQQRDTILDKLAFGAERLAAVNIKKINEDIDALTAGLSTNASDAITEQFRKKIQGIRDEATAARVAASQADNPADQQTFTAQAAVLDALATKYETQGAALADLADKQDQYNRAIQTVTEAQQASNAVFTGSVPTLDAVKAANAVLVEAELELKKRVDDTTLSLDEHNKALADLARIQGALNGTPLPPLTKPAADADLLAVGLLSASNNAAQLAQNLGASGGALGKLASAGIKLAAILKAVKTAQEVNAVGSTASAATRLSSKADVISLVVGGVLEVANAIDLFGADAAKRAKELRAAAVTFNRALAEFAIVDLTDFESKIRDNLKKASSVADAGLAASGFKTEGPGFDFKSSADIKQAINELNQAAAGFDKSNKDMAAAARASAAALEEIYNETLANEAKLQIAHDAEVQRNSEDLSVRALIASGRNDDAAALRLQFEQARELAEAQKDTTAAGAAYVAHLQEVQAAEKEAAAQARVLANAQRALDDQLKAFGLTGKDALGAIVDSLKAQFVDIRDVVDGLDLSTQAGLDALKERGKALFATFNADGTITDDEQKILDALFKIFDTASDVFDSLAERVQRSLSKLADDNTVLGGSAGDQFGRTVQAATGFSAVLDGILGSVDLSSSGGADAFRKQLQGLYTSLLTDGLTEEESVIVDLIKTLLSGLDNAVDEATQTVEAKIARGVADRQRNQTSASRLNNVADAEGIAAYANFLSGLASSISSLFSEFDVSQLQGVDAAKQRLVALNASIDSLSNDQVLSQFGVTRDELLEAIGLLDTSFDGLKASALSAADAAIELANRQRDITDSTHDEFLRESGDTRTADLNAAKAATQKKLEDAKAAGVSQSVLDEIIKTGQLKLDNIQKQYSEQAAAALPKSEASIATAQSTTSTSVGLTSLSNEVGVSLIGIGQTHTTILRSILGALLNPFPRVSVPSLPPSMGTFSQGASNGNVFVTIQVSGNLSTKENTRELARLLAPEISTRMATRASGERARMGV